jgi:hypothetical protein
MHRSSRSVLVTIVTIALLVFLAGPAHAQNSAYTFTTILDSAGSLTADHCAAINNNGQIAFTVTNENFNQTILRALPLSMVDNSVQRFLTT